MNVTINTDASFSGEFSCGGFAFWMICDCGKIQKSGELRGEITSSQHSEMACIANALYTLKYSKWSKIHKIVINTDSQACIDVLQGESRGYRNKLMRKVSDEAYFLMLELCIKYGFTIRDVGVFIEFRHVKAHTKNNDSRSLVNKWCDEQAKLYLKQIIKNKNNGN